MFKRKKLVFAVAIALIAVLCTLCFVACNVNENTGEKHITVYVGEKTFEVTTTESNLHGVLTQLYNDGKLTAYVTNDSGFGAYITQIDELVQSDGKYYSVWHSLDRFELKNVYQEAYADFNPSRATTKNEDGTVFVVTVYGENTLYYSGVGISMLPIIEGGVYAVFVD
ncbi:MAG: hypothetical protein K2J16_05480 [Clostridia bacterium]|nr:hypothetical protein [Clostridia bacterium]